MPENEPGPVEELPCGCRMYNVGETFVFEPHDLQCPYYLYLLEQVAEQNRPLTVVEMP